MAKFNTKATAAKQAAAAGAAREAAAAADAIEATASAAAAAAAQAASCVSMPAAASASPAVPEVVPASAGLSAQQPVGSCATSISATQHQHPAEQLQLPYLQPSYMLYPPTSQHLQLGGFPAHAALQALGGLPALHAASSPVVMASAAQLMAADMQAATLMSCGYPAAALLSQPGTLEALMPAAGTPPAECLSLMQPTLMFASPTSTRLQGSAAAGLGPQAAAAVASSSPRVKAPNKQALAPPSAAAPGSAAAVGSGSIKTSALTVHAAAGSGSDRTEAAHDQQLSGKPKAAVVLKL